MNGRLTLAMSPVTSTRARDLGLIALALVSLTLSGCASVLGRHAAPASAEVPAAAADPLAEARAAMAQDSTGAWTPYHLAQLELARGSASEAEKALAVTLERDPCYAPAIALMPLR